MAVPVVRRRTALRWSKRVRRAAAGRRCSWRTAAERLLVRTEVGHPDAQGAREMEQRQVRRVSLAAFDEAEVGDRKASRDGEVRLGEFTGAAQVSGTCSKLLQGFLLLRSADHRREVQPPDREGKAQVVVVSSIIRPVLALRMSSPEAIVRWPPTCRTETQLRSLIPDRPALGGEVGVTVREGAALDRSGEADRGLFHRRARRR